MLCLSPRARRGQDASLDLPTPASGLELVCQRRVFEVWRQVVQSGAVFLTSVATGRPLR